MKGGESDRHKDGRICKGIPGYFVVYNEEYSNMTTTVPHTTTKMFLGIVMCIVSTDVGVSGI